MHSHESHELHESRESHESHESQFRVLLLALIVALSMAFAPMAIASPAFADDESLTAGDDGSLTPGSEPVSVASGTLSLPSSFYPYTGKAVCPSVSLSVNGATLAQGVDYALSYRSNVKVGMATVTATGMGDYSGSVSKAFKIAYPISKAKASKVRAVTYRGKAYKPKPKVKYGKKTLKRGRDYKVKYLANKNAGKAEIVIAGAGSYAGTKLVKFTIRKASVSSASVAGVPDKKYTGLAITPSPKVKLAGKTLKKGRDYTLAYSGNRKAGTAKVKVRGIGNYKGSKTVSFKIYKPQKKSSPARASAGGGTVYWTPNGSVYHVSRGCPSLARSSTVLSGSVAASGKPRVCKNCG